MTVGSADHVINLALDVVPSCQFRIKETTQKAATRALDWLVSAEFFKQ